MAARTPLALRVAVMALAVLAGAWFVLGIVQAHAITAATTILNSPNALTARQVSDARSQLATAGTLNPDLQVDVLRAELLQSENENAAARVLYRSIVRREPDNVLAWDLLAQDGDPAALAQVARLEPNVPSR